MRNCIMEIYIHFFVNKAEQMQIDTSFVLCRPIMPVVFIAIRSDGRNKYIYNLPLLTFEMVTRYGQDKNEW